MSKTELDLIRKWMKMPAQEMRLRFGEMTNQEIRTVRAVLRNMIDELNKP